MRNELHGISELSTYSDGTDGVGRDEWSFITDDRYRPPAECGNESACTAACAAGADT